MVSTLCLAAPEGLAGVVAKDSPARLGVLAFRPKPETQARWQPLADYFNAAGLPIRLEVYTYPELDAAVRERRVDFLLTQPAHYAALAKRETLYSPLATLLEGEAGQVLPTLGGVIVTLVERKDIHELRDLRGKRIALHSRHSLGAYLAQAVELLEVGIELPRDAVLIENSSSQDLAVEALVAGTVDVAFVRTGLLESLAEAGRIDMKRFKVLRAPGVPDFPLALSTRLYPQWALAAMPWADGDLARELAAAALGLSHGGPVARASRIHGFTIPGNYAAVEQAMRRLRMPPFDQAEFRFADVWDRYFWAIMLVAVAFGLVIVLAFRLDHFRRSHEQLARRLGDAQRRARIGHWEHDPQTNRLTWSDEVFRIFEIDPGRFGGTIESFLAAVHPDDRSAVAAAYARSLETGEPYAVEHRIALPDGRIKYLAENCETLRGTDGRPVVSRGTVQDITAQKAAQEQIALSEQRLRLAIGASRMAWFDANLETGTVELAPEYARMLGYDPATFESSIASWLDHLHPDDRDAVKAAFDDVLKSGGPSSMDYRRQNAVGGWTWIQSTAEIVERAPDGCPRRMAGVHADVTERKAAEQALRESEARATAYVERAPTGIFVADSTGRFVEVNPAACEMLGYLRGELLGGMGIQDIAGTGDLSSHVALFTEVQRTGHGEFDLRLCRRDGATLVVSLHAAVLPDGKVIGFALEVTEARALQDALSAMATTLAPLAGEDYFRAVSKHLAEALRLDYVFVGRANPELTEVEAIAGWAEGGALKPFRYELAGTPCANVMKRQHAVYPCDIQSLYPQDELLAQMGIESYVGASLFDREGSAIGILVGLSKAPIRQESIAEKLLTLFVDSVGAELERVRIEKVLRESESHYRTLFDDSSIVMLLVDPITGAIREANAAAAAFYGYSVAALRTMHIGEINTLPKDEIRREMERARAEGRRNFEFRHRLAGGAVRDVLVSSGPIRIDGRELLLSTVLDVTERRLAEQRMRQALAVFNASNQGIFTTDLKGTITSVNPAFTEITGYAAEEAIGRTTALLKSGRHDKTFYRAMWAELAATGRWEGEVWNRRRSGQVYPEWLTISCVRDTGGQVVEYVGLFSDITERKQHEEDIWRKANFDALTGLANRNLFVDRLERAIAQAKRNEKKVGLAFLDLDGFKWINDTLGHDVGDELLVEIAQRLRNAVRDQDTVARLGGDEFTVVIHDLDDPQDMLSIGAKLVELLREPMTIGGSTHQISGSIGITLYPDDGEDVQTLLKNADIAMYKAKQCGKNRYQFYARHMQVDAQARVRMEADLRVAIETDAFRLHYQPIVDADSGELVGAEALVRWQHPERGLVPPLDFIPVAEDCGLIVPIGDWVLREAARQWHEWRRRGYPALSVSVNVSSVQFREAGLHDAVAQVLRQFGMPPGSLVLEITESVLMDGSPEAEARLRDIKALGVAYSLDDFGTGFSSLSYLKRFPVDAVKVDRGFVSDCPDDRNDAHLVEAIVNMAHSLGLRVTAEGVETEAQLEFLRDLGCDTVQGYLVGRPLPPESFEVLIERRQILLPTDDASVEESRLLAALRDNELDVDRWVERLLGDHDQDHARFARDENLEIGGFNLRDAIDAHLAWRRRLDDLVSGRHKDAALMTTAEAGSHECCELGQWIKRHRDPIPASFARLDAVHRAFHRIAGQIAEDHTYGHRGLARRALSGSGLRKASRDVIVALIDCYRELRQDSPA